MSDTEALLTRFARGDLLRPSINGPSIVDLSRALAMLNGVPDVEPSAHAASLAEQIGDHDHLVFVLADGLGMNLVESLPEASFLAEHLAGELLTVFPSTTPTALTSLATGAWPSEHGVVGWWTYLPEIATAGALLPFITRNGGQSLVKAGLTIEQAFPLTPLMSQMQRDTMALLSVQFVDTSASRYFTGGQPRRGYWTLAEAIDLVVGRIECAAEPTYTYIYSPRVDLAAHRHGIGRQEVRAAVAEIATELTRLRQRFGERVRIVLTADHGLSDTTPEAQHVIRPVPELFEVLRCPPTGDARVLFLHVQDGAEEDAIRLFRRRFGDRFLLLTIAEVEQLELLGPGPLSPLAAGRAGDLVAISTGTDVIEYAPVGTVGRVLSSHAHHSGLTPAEMRVPLVII